MSSTQTHQKLDNSENTLPIAALSSKYRKIKGLDLNLKITFLKNIII